MHFKNLYIVWLSTISHQRISENRQFSKSRTYQYEYQIVYNNYATTAINRNEQGAAQTLVRFQTFLNRMLVEAAHYIDVTTLAVVIDEKLHSTILLRVFPAGNRKHIVQRKISISFGRFYQFSKE